MERVKNKNNKENNKPYLKNKKLFSELKFKDIEYSDPEDVLTLLNDVIKFLNKTDDFNKALSYAINKICDYSLWDLGHCFVFSNNKLISSKIWNNTSDSNFNIIKEYAEKLSFKPGEGIPGICFENKKPFWILLKNIHFENHFPKIRLAKKMGINTGIWVPILCGENVVAVLEFFSVLKKPPGKQIINAVVNIADELGNLMEKNIVLEKIRSREKLLKEIQRMTNIGSWEKNLASGEFYLSEELYNILDFEKKEGIPVLKVLKNIIHRDDIKEVSKLLKKFLIKPFPFRLKFRITSKEGDLRYLYSVTQVDYDAEKNPSRIYGSIQDITHIKQYEDELYYANKKILEIQKELIQNEKLAALGRFSAGIAHEIRNPLANISALSQLILKKPGDKKKEKYFRMILDNTKIANQIIKDLLNYASPEKLVLKNENVLEIFNEIINNIQARCEKNKIKLKIKIENNLPLVQVDKLRLKMAMMNFISNSIEAMTRGGELNLKVYKIKRMDILKIEIIDTGVGIQAENLDNIFEPFFTTKQNGTGLGLGLAYRIITSHSGDVKIKSIPNSGTTVKIDLPIKKSNGEK